VQVVAAAAGVERVLLAVEGELALGDAVGVPADDRAEVGVGLAVEVWLQRAVAQHDVGHLAVAVGHVEFGEVAAEVGDLRDESVAVGQGVQVHGLSPSLVLPNAERVTAEVVRGEDVDRCRRLAGQPDQPVGGFVDARRSRPGSGRAPPRRGP